MKLSVRRCDPNQEAVHIDVDLGRVCLVKVVSLADGILSIIRCVRQHSLDYRLGRCYILNEKSRTPRVAARSQDGNIPSRVAKWVEPNNPLAGGASQALEPVLRRV